ncbi:MAG: TIR domain-containing protein [Promethearchaeota archaeon]|jgi:hypothetical protein
MRLLTAKEVRSIQDRYYELLVNAPGSKVEKQKFFKNKGIKVPKTNYEAMWERMIDRVGRAAAGEAIFDYVLYSANDRLKKLLNLARDGEQVKLREKDSNIVHDLFWRNGYPRKIGEYLIDYMDETDYKWEHDKSVTKPQEEPIIKKKFEWDVAISFAGEDRQIAEKLANKFRSHGIKVFYDEFYKSKLWGKNLSNYFRKVYGPKSRYVIPLVSKHFPVKDWTNFEFSIARDEAKARKSEFILPIRLDNTKIFGLQDDIAYIDYSKEGIDGIVEIFVSKLSEFNDDNKLKDTTDDIRWLLDESTKADEIKNDKDYRESMDNIHQSGTTGRIRKLFKKRE